MSFRRSRRPAYLNKDKQNVEGLVLDRPPPRIGSSTADLAAIAAATTVVPRKVPDGVRVLSDKQAYLAFHATDEYVHASRHFVGELQARVGVRNPVPVVPRPKVELTPEEEEAERTVRLRRYWARKRRGAP
jgi:hypothetical protein